MKSIVILVGLAVISLYGFFFLAYKLNMSQWFYTPSLIVVMVVLVFLVMATLLAIQDRAEKK